MAVAYRPNQFTQALRMMRRRLPRGTTLLVVEGGTERSVFMPFVRDDVLVIKARGRDNLLDAYNRLEQDLREDVLFLMDCDGGVAPAYKGKIDLIITTNRDLEADLLLVLKGLLKPCIEYIGHRFQSKAELRAAITETQDAAVQFAVKICAVRAAAVELGLPCRRPGPRGQRRSRVQPHELPSIPVWASMSPPLAVGIHDIAADLGSVVGWDSSQVEAVGKRAAEIYVDPCLRHSAVGCHACDALTSCGGHDLVSAVWATLTYKHGLTKDLESLEEGIRMSVDGLKAAKWPVMDRMRRWEAATAFQVLESPD